MFDLLVKIFYLNYAERTRHVYYLRDIPRVREQSVLREMEREKNGEGDPGGSFP